MNNAEQDGSITSDLVVIGASAGGVEALSILLGTLPADFPAPIVVAEHLDPERHSELGSILQRATRLNVVVITDGQPLRLTAGTAYIVPANRHVVIEHGKVELQDDHQPRPRPSVDLLLSTAAADHGDRVIAVILTGAGSDGAAGAVAVKAAGGTVIIQNPATARFPAMPMALPPTAIDHVADLEAIGPLLHDLVTGQYVADQAERMDGTLHTILELINRQANIDFRPYKMTTIIRRIGRRMAVTKTQTITDYTAYLQRHPEEIGELVAAFLINVTEFFRDPDVFRHLREHVLPGLIEQGRARDRVLRFWCAGCATGEEPYSLAMLLADMLGAELAEWSIRIFATDLDEAAINYARNGVYPANVLHNLPDGFEDRFFEQVNDVQESCRISKTLRAMVTFGHQDLSRQPPFPRIDLILCRNVLIYFTPELQEYVLNQFAFALRPRHGYLVLGRAETVRSRLEYFEIVSKPWRVYRCVSDDMALPRLKRPVVALLTSGPGAPSRSTRSVTHQGLEGVAGVADSNQIRHMNELLLRFLPVGIAVIDRSYKIVSINAAARRLLGLRDMSSEHDFLHAVRGIPYNEARNAIDTVFRQHSPVSLAEVVMGAAPDGQEHALSLAFVHMQMDASGPELVAITIQDVTEQMQIRRRLEVAQAQQADLLVELEAANARLNVTNRELIDANEQLQVSNEELMLTHEELQASVEEFETTNEELQAANEELETSNEELQATNEELETTNDELRATMAEVQAISGMLDSDRARLAAMVELAPFYIVVTHGPQLIVDEYDRRYDRMVGPQQIKGRPLAEVHHLLWSTDDVVLNLAREAFQRNQVRISPRVQALVEDPHGQPSQQYMVFTIVPRRNAEGAHTGVVIYAADETLQAQQQAAAERDLLRLIFDRANEIALVLYDAQSRELLMASRRYAELAAEARGIAPDALIGRNVADVAVLQDPDPDDLWEQVLRDRTPLHRPEVRLPMPDGSETIWSWTLSPIADRDRPDVVKYMLVTAIDVTDQVKAREELIRVDQLKDQFLTLASHELRTPLTSLIGYAYLLQRKIDDVARTDEALHSAQLVEYAGTFTSQLRRLQRLVDDLVDVARLQTGKFSLQRKPLDLRELVQQAVEESGRQINQAITIHTATDAPLIILGDRDRLMQVITNLLQNAITYAPNSPTLDVRLSHVADGADRPRIAQIDVQDYGQGIAPDALPQLFERFYQVARTERTSRSGLGLGLYICKQIVEQHGGTIDAESTVGQGTTFHVRLPLTTSNSNGQNH